MTVISFPSLCVMYLQCIVNHGSPQLTVSSVALSNSLFFTISLSFGICSAIHWLRFIKQVIHCPSQFLCLQCSLYPLSLFSSLYMYKNISCHFLSVSSRSFFSSKLPILFRTFLFFTYSVHGILNISE